MAQSSPHYSLTPTAVPTAAAYAEISALEFREAMSRLTTAVSVITTDRPASHRDALLARNDARDMTATLATAA